MVIQIVELGPFGCRINRGQADDIEDIPEGYKAVSVKAHQGCTIVYIEPIDE